MARSTRTGSALSNLSVHSGSQDMDESDALLPSYAELERKKKDEEGSQCIAARHVLAIMAFLGFVNVYCLRVDLSVALVAMVNSSSSSSNSSKSTDCPAPGKDNSTSPAKVGEFDWDETTQGYILGAFFYGYIVTQVPGGWLASKFGGKNLFGYGVLCTSVLTLITPVAARYSVYLLIAVRVLEGLGEGVTFPAMHAMWGSWAPVWERSKLAAFTYAGAQLGTVISMPVSGLLCDSDFGGGWPSAFYVFGSLGCVWFVAWMFLVHNTPAEHPRISTSEREYIESSVGKREHIKTPWLQILTCPALWGISLAHFTNNWCYYTLLTCLPAYMSNILRFNLKENGLLSAMPYAVCFLTQNTSGVLADFLRGRGYLSTGNARKLFTSIGLLSPAIFLIVVNYVGCDHVLAVLFLTLSVGLQGCIMGGYNINHLDIAPKFAGVLMGITNSLGTIPGFMGPAVVGYLTNNNQTRGQWQIVFYITAGMCFVGAIGYDLLAKGEEMPWSRLPHKEQEIIVPERTRTPVTRSGRPVSIGSVNVNSSDTDLLVPPPENNQ
ncbi:sialin [Biomphalaria glabrata]|uniref:Sialin n=1 Tax=Biomphalaria glabrata TaxID=6526 RepID=A0A9W2Z8A8_BIOGL|nr:sialin-like [Biomphalaria glabrata]XP_055871148.1 sialin-like [Biomphalaria glabrata]XP_055871149.1 sialin-like [Biomphalaria glabrata]XP_055871150.1 sialin-like [Biomphalaria glabrata]XP_055871151.1 sialin-like [Biomphalaria glabrata]XP_055871152.1 sialin-like [Biomphalaria glabrata]KAI8737196.1 sialin-like [Biomphalaria glabrata]